MLDIDTAIKHCLEVAEQNDVQAEKWREEGGEEWGKTTACRECAADYRQFAEWLMELKDLRAEQNDQYVFIHELMSELVEAKRLLKAAVEDIESTDNCCLCKYYDKPAESCQTTDDCFIWRYADEAQNLLNHEKINNVE